MVPARALTIGVVASNRYTMETLMNLGKVVKFDRSMKT